jgi:DNA-binding beta-propeller fold protein YncE
MRRARTNQAAGRLGAALCAALLVGACAATAPVTAPVPAQVWPEPPEPPRLGYVRSFSRPADLGIKKSFLERIAEFIVGASDARLIRPMAVVEGSDGTLYVADPGAQGVQSFDTQRGRHRLIQGATDTPLPSPVGLAAGARGEVYVADSALAQVLVIKPGAKHATPLPRQSGIRQPTGLAFDPAGQQLVVVDTAAHQVYFLGLDGTPRGSFGRRGTGDGEFNFPTLIWRDAEGRLYVTDSLNFRIQIFDAEGRFLNRFGRHGDATGDLSRPKGVATDRFGHVYVIDSLFHALQVFDRNGVFLLHVGGQGRAAGEFWLPAGLFVGNNDTLYIADSYNQRVQVLRYIGGQP